MELHFHDNKIFFIYFSGFVVSFNVKWLIPEKKILSHFLCGKHNTSHFLYVRKNWAVVWTCLIKGNFWYWQRITRWKYLFLCSNLLGFKQPKILRTFNIPLVFHFSDFHLYEYEKKKECLFLVCSFAEFQCLFATALFF